MQLDDALEGDHQRQMILARLEGLRIDIFVQHAKSICKHVVGGREAISFTSLLPVPSFVFLLLPFSFLVVVGVSSIAFALEEWPKSIGCRVMLSLRDVHQVVACLMCSEGAKTTFPLLISALRTTHYYATVQHRVRGCSCVVKSTLLACIVAFSLGSCS